MSPNFSPTCRTAHLTTCRSFWLGKSLALPKVCFPSTLQGRQVCSGFCASRLKAILVVADSHSNKKKQADAPSNFLIYPVPTDFVGAVKDCDPQDLIFVSPQGSPSPQGSISERARTIDKIAPHPA